jgi:hypothetical protein
MDREEIAHLRLEGRWHSLTEHLGGVRKRRSHPGVQGIDLVGGQRRPLPEWEQSRGVEDLVAVRITDASHERLVAEQVLELAWVAPDPLTPDVERQRRIVRVGPDLVRAQAGHDPFQVRGQEIDLAHLRGIAIADLRVGLRRWEP